MVKCWDGRCDFTGQGQAVQLWLAGYYVNGKVTLPSVTDGESRTHQISCSMVEIGTKGRFEPAKKKE